MNIGIVGSRRITDYSIVENFIEKTLYVDRNDIIVSGGAIGIDTLAERFAKERTDTEPLIFKPDWDTGDSAPFDRNSLIVEHSDIIIAFVDKYSKGTWDTIEKAHRKKITVYVCMINEGIAGI